MTKFKFLVFIDDDYPTNVYHELIVNQAQVCEKYLFFESADRALDFFKEQAEQKKPDLPEAIFVDINMPSMNGWEFIECYNALKIETSPTFIILSTSTYFKDLEKSENEDLVYNFIQKPLTEEVLMRLNQELVK